MAAPRSLLDLAISWNLPRFSSGFWGRRFLAAAMATPLDAMNQAAATAFRVGNLYDTRARPIDLTFEQPALAVEYLGLDSLLPLGDQPAVDGTLPTAALLARLRAKWAHHSGGPRAALESELDRTGYDATTVIPGEPAAPSDSHADFWARFWVDFADGDHPLTEPAAVVGAATVGTDRIGPFAPGVGGEPAARWWTGLLAVVGRARPAQWVPWDFRFELASSTIALMGHYRFQDPDYEYETP